MKRTVTMPGTKEFPPFGEYRRLYSPMPFETPPVTEEEILEDVIRGEKGERAGSVRPRSSPKRVRTVNPLRVPDEFPVGETPPGDAL